MLNLQVLEGFECSFPEVCLLNSLCLQKHLLFAKVADSYRMPTMNLVTALLTFPLLVLVRKGPSRTVPLWCVLRNGNKRRRTHSLPQDEKAADLRYHRINAATAEPLVRNESVGKQQYFLGFKGTTTIIAAPVISFSQRQ